jgi:hypothetical protein
VTLKLVYTFACAATLANGAWMLAAPWSWYTRLPAAVPDTGPFNPHFVRDIGITYVVIAAVFAWCARHLDRCRPAHLALTLLFGGHALLHAVEIAGGRLPGTHWLIDLPLVFLPAVVVGVFALPPVWKRVTTQA